VALKANIARAAEYNEYMVTNQGLALHMRVRQISRNGTACSQIKNSKVKTRIADMTTQWKTNTLY